MKTKEFIEQIVDTTTLGEKSLQISSQTYLEQWKEVAVDYVGLSYVCFGYCGFGKRIR